MSRHLEVSTVKVPWTADHRALPNKVRLGVYNFDGIETEHSDLCTMDPDTARDVGQQLIAAANRIDHKPAADKTKAKIRKAVKAAADEARRNGEVPGQ